MNTATLCSDIMKTALDYQVMAKAKEHNRDEQRFRDSAMQRFKNSEAGDEWTGKSYLRGFQYQGSTRFSC